LRGARAAKDVPGAMRFDGIRERRTLLVPSRWEGYRRRERLKPISVRNGGASRHKSVRSNTRLRRQVLSWEKTSSLPYEGRKVGMNSEGERSRKESTPIDDLFTGGRGKKESNGFSGRRDGS